MSKNKKTYEETRGRHAKEENNNAVNKRKKAKAKTKTVRKVKRVVVTLLLLLIMGAGTLFGYKIYKNGGGLTGTLATLLGENTEDLENLEPIQLLIMVLENL